MLRFASIFGFLAAASFGMTTVCSAATPISNDQHFHGLVNGRHANAVVYVVCPGPVWQGRTGHPTGKQVFSVKEVSAGGGFTGNVGGGIFARFGTNPHSSGVLFTTYDTPQPIPTAWTVPCGGTGTVIFQPEPIVSGSGRSTGKPHPDVVGVTYENIAV